MSVSPTSPTARLLVQRVRDLPAAVVTRLVVAGVVALGALHHLSWLQVWGPDGISYLDAGDAWWRGDWDVALSPYWSPMYSWVAGLALKVAGPSAHWEAPVVQVLNYAIYLFVAASFAWLVREMRLAGAGRGIGDVAWTLIAWSVFVWCVYTLTTPNVMSPDLLSAGFVFLSAGLLTRIMRGQATTGTFAVLGVVLGLNALAKAAMFPMAAVFVVVAALATRPLRRGVARAALAAAVCAVVVAPYVTALSLEVDKPTFGESGRLNYAWFVDGASQVHWQGEPQGSGTPVHPTKQLHASPDVFTFPRPGHGSIPTWYDPAYFDEGLTPFFDAEGQLRVIRHSFENFTQQRIFMVPFTGFALGVALLLFAAQRRRAAWREAIRWWPLIVPAWAVVAMYAVVHLEQRHTGAFAALFWLPALSAAAAGAFRSPRLRTAGIALALSGSVLMLGAGGLRDARNLAVGIIDPPVIRNEHWIVAEHLLNAGVGPGARLAYLGEFQESFGAYYARLSGSQLVGEIVGSEAYWRAPPAERRRLLGLVRDAGATVVLSRHAGSAEGAGDGWRPVPQTRYYIKRLEP